MVSSVSVAAWIAHIAFVVMLVVGWGELWRGRVIFPLLWLLGYLAQSHVPYGPACFIAYVAIIDVVLVFMVFKGDVPLR